MSRPHFRRRSLHPHLRGIATLRRCCELLLSNVRSRYGVVPPHEPVRYAPVVRREAQIRGADHSRFILDAAASSFALAAAPALAQQQPGQQPSQNRQTPGGTTSNPQQTGSTQIKRPDIAATS
jgi:hypothetical protein